VEGRQNSPGCGVGCRYKCTRGDAAAARCDRRYSGVEMPLGDEERDEGEGDSRNQDDNRRVGAVMHDAQIRAIIPITVQIIVRELVAVNASPPPKHNRHARLRTATTRGPSRYRPTESWVEANFGCDFGLEIARMKEIERRCAFETDISTWQLRFDSLPDNVAVSPRSRMS